MGMERRGEQSISLSMSRIAEMATSAVTNRVKDGDNHNDLYSGIINIQDENNVFQDFVSFRRMKYSREM